MHFKSFFVALQKKLMLFQAMRYTSRRTFSSTTYNKRAKGEKGIKKCNRCNVRPFPCFCLTNISFLPSSPPYFITVCENSQTGIVLLLKIGEIQSKSEGYFTNAIQPGIVSEPLLHIISRKNSDRVKKDRNTRQYKEKEANSKTLECLVHRS